MNNRVLAIAVIAAALVGVLPAAAQTDSDRAGQWTAPRAPDGRPDLQGVWANNNITPMERPTALVDRAFLTEEELARLKANADRLFAVMPMTPHSAIRSSWLRSRRPPSSPPMTVAQATTISFG